ncbi:MAG TPA: sigma-70 family RNA polymerase sigma factor [Planctomycetota bacterium]|nr:sigma-70 family RNA polymerase sigma factor [Planctomycetota bacterium]
MTDWNETVQNASRGDEHAIESLLARHLPRLRAFVRLRMGAELRARESASDLVQSACREVLARLDRFRYRGEANFRRWLFTMALRKIRNRVVFHRAEKRDWRREVPEGDHAEVGDLAAVYADFDTPSAQLDLKERIARLEAAFDGLSDEHREVITLARIVGLSHQEIGEAMGRSEAASRMLLYRALAELGERLDRGGAGTSG